MQMEKVSNEKNDVLLYGDLARWEPLRLLAELSDSVASQMPLSDDKYVPRSFSEAHLRGNLQWWKIVTDDGHEWRVKCRHAAKRRAEIKLEGDWLNFYEKNQLKFEDACLLELVEGEERTLKVIFFRSSD
ncbi:hypothetical protein L6164_007741 [Bauhinia variegata]|uniref:Uncharacterized protein n=1 Tax=Bauhinia variegata TaxID=167791 RepID=A0ACB9PEJ1_BAUVA|nr:hypothetical protein L6164_007741 [Bauhinia variegata]